MEQEIHDIMNALKREGLAEHERIALRHKLKLFMHEHPLRVPVRIRILGALRVSQQGAYLFAPQRAVAVFTLALFLCTGIGSSYAAEHALPGDTLYFVKVKINEPVAGALALSDTRKAQWGVSLTERRLEEAEALAAEGRLGESESQVIVSLLDASRAKFDERIAALDNSESDDVLAADVRSDLRSSLDAHAFVLEELAAEVPAVQQAIEPVISAIRQHDVEPAAKTSEVIAIAASTTPDIPNTGADDRKAKKLLERKRQRAMEQLEDVRALAKKVRGELSSSTIAQIRDVASTTEMRIDQAYTTGETQYDEAIESYTESIRSAKKIKASLQAAVRLRRSGRTQSDDFISRIAPEGGSANSSIHADKKGRSEQDDERDDAEVQSDSEQNTRQSEEHEGGRNYPHER